MVIDHNNYFQMELFRSIPQKIIGFMNYLNSL